MIYRRQRGRVHPDRFVAERLELLLKKMNLWVRTLEREADIFCTYVRITFYSSEEYRLTMQMDGGLLAQSTAK